jgi:O-antigen/teichoic acid export membrane protein
METTMAAHPNPRPATGQTIAKGALVLGAAAVVSKLLGTIQKIPLQNMAGDAVFGIYNAVYPLYILILTLATAGFPIAVSRFVAEERAVGNPDGARAVLRMALIVSTAAGVAGFAVLYFGAPVFSALIGVRHTEAALRSVSFALFFVPALAALRGYFQGLSDMVPTAVSQVAEQFVRVAVMLALLIVLLQAGAGEETVAAGATFGSAAGAFAGLLAVLLFWRRRRAGEQVAAKTRKPPLRAASVGYRRFVGYAISVCAGSIVLPALTLADTFTMPRLLKQTVGETAAMAQYGVYNHGVPLVQLVAMIASSMSVALVPAMSEAKRLGSADVARGRAELSLRLTWLIGLAASAGMAVAAAPLSVMLYGSPEGDEVMALLAFSAVFSVLQIVSAALLQGVGEAKRPAYYLLAAAGVKVGLNAALMPMWGIKGAAAAAVAAYATAAGLNLMRLYRIGLIRLSWRGFVVKSFASAAVMSAAVFAVIWASEHVFATVLPLSVRWRETMAALLAVGTGVAVFAVMILRTRLVGAAELEAMPGLGSRLLPLLRRWRFIPIEGGFPCPHPSPSSDSAPGTKTN